TDRDGRLAPDLARDVFQIRDDGKPQTITVFSNEIQPIRVVVMLDRSTSMRGNLRLVERAAEEFVGRLAPDDKAPISTFPNRIVVQPDQFPSDKETLLGILRSDLPSSGPTPLWNAIDDAIAALKEQDGRKVVLVFSDGGDSPGNMRTDNRSMGDVMR